MDIKNKLSELSFISIELWTHLNIYPLQMPKEVEGKKDKFYIQDKIYIHSMNNFI